MRHISFYISLTLLVIAGVGCRQQTEVDMQADCEECQKSIITAIIEDGKTTRTVLGTPEDGVFYPLWKESDEVAVFFNLDVYSCLNKFTLLNGAGTREAMFEGEWESYNGTRVGLYPYSSLTEEGCYNNVLTLRLQDVQQYAEGSFGDGTYPMISVGKTNVLRFKNLCSVLHFSMTGTDAVDSIRFLSHDSLMFVSGKGTVRLDYDTEPELVMSEEGSPELTLLCGGVALNPDEPTDFFIVIPPGMYKGGFELEIISKSGKVIRSTQNDVFFKRSQYRTIPTFAFVPEKEPGSDSEMVDMGLSVRWATCNLGASSPEECGNYYAWGEVKSKDSFSPFYSWFANGSLNRITKYCYDPSYGNNGYTDYQVYLQPEDDAAHCELGDQWRIPTKGEVDELIQNTSMTKTTRNGVDGFDLVSQVNGNHLFIPAAGYKLGDVVYSSGQNGEYWTADLGADQPPIYAGVVLLRETQKQISEDLRYIGHSIRPVYGDPIVSVSGVSLNKSMTELLIGRSQTLIASVLPSEAYNPSVCWSSSDTTVAIVYSSGVVYGRNEGTANIIVTTMDGGKTACCEVVVKSASSVPGPEAIDLGLSVKWASCNVGASSPEEYGDYFSWGEVSPKTDYSWGTYQWCKGAQNSLTKYCYDSQYGYNGFSDGLKSLVPGDDAATVNWGLHWRMPTSEELRELEDNTMLSLQEYNGVMVFALKSKINGNVIYLPIAGYRDENPGIQEPGTYRGFYWSSDIDRDRTYDGYNLCVTNKDTATLTDENYFGYFTWAHRYKGYTIRPVYVSSLPDCDNRIYYTSTDGTVVPPNSTSVFGANLVSNDYIDGLGILTFDSKITSVGSRAFLGCNTLTSITLPESVTSIEGAAFAGCHNLASINVPEGVTSIGAHAFESCNSLTEIIIPESVTVIADRAFQFCQALKSISIPAKVTRIGVDAFIACESLSSISVASGNTVYDSRNNSNAIIKTATNTLIAGCMNTVIPASVTSIGDLAFYASSKMAHIDIPASITSIGYRSFAFCSKLTRVSIPSSVESISGLAFETCSNLRRLEIPSPVPPTTESDILSNSYDCLIYVPYDAIETYQTADGWNSYASRIRSLKDTSMPEPDAIDLGLSVKWASFNLGASKPEEYGDYYAWGEIEPYYSSINPLTWKEGKSAGYAWASYQFNPSGDGASFTKYTRSDYSTLQPEDDAATVHLGDPWRTPTFEEWQELKDYCSVEWIEDYNNSGIKGYLITSNIVGYTSNSIFLSAANFWDSNPPSSHYQGYYWSSSLYSGGWAYNVYFDRNFEDWDDMHKRYLGLPLRPVYVK